MLETGGFDEALTRAVLYVMAADQMLDQRCALALNVARQQLMHLPLADFKILVRDQFFVLQLEPDRAIEVLASLVPEADARSELLKQVRAIAGAGDPLTTAENDRLAQLSRALAVPREADACDARPVLRLPCDRQSRPRAALSMTTLNGKKGLIIGIANEHSLALGCARHFRAAGAELAITYLNAKAEPFVRPLAEALQSTIIMPCDVTVPGQLEAVYERIAKDWGRLDFVQHSIAYARKEDLSGRITDCSAEGFALAMQVSVHSFLRMAKLSEPLMTAGGCSACHELLRRRKSGDALQCHGAGEGSAGSCGSLHGPRTRAGWIRVNALSPGPVKTRAASGIDHFDELLERAVREAPEHRLVTLDDVGAYAAFLVSDAAKAITGNIAYVDAGYHVVA